VSAPAAGAPPPRNHPDTEPWSRSPERFSRRRRSAQVTPALVERMDVADGDPHVDVEAAAGRRVRDGSSPLDRISAALNSRYAAVVIGNVLVVVLILGLALTH
jgi:hypothetical protein